MKNFINQDLYKAQELLALALDKNMISQKQQDVLLHVILTILKVILIYRELIEKDLDLVKEDNK